MALGKSKGGGDESIEVPMSSMIDVVFLLLIYFIVTFKEIVPEAHITVNLPAPGEGTPQTTEAEPIEVKVLDGAYTYQGAMVSLATVEEQLMTIGETTPNATIVIKVHTEAVTQNLVDLLDRCKRAGLTSLNVMTIE
jgi:biopolymer transport protein ExbD